MRMYDLIEKKKQGKKLEKEEIRFMVKGFTEGSIPDYQMSAMLMAIYFQGMEDQEITDLTLEIAASGDRLDLSAIKGFKADKHSTGGVGDKTTLILGPIVASLGVKVAKISGRGLGHTGGTVDKMESVPGTRTSLTEEEFFRLVNENGIAVMGQTGNLVPADKKLYALRDVTATIDSVPLIASSIMSKKLSSGSDGIVLDVKTGRGAFMKTLEDSELLARKMVAIGAMAGRRCCALITDMDVPLGHAIGNSMEVMEAIETLKGNGPEDLTRVCLHLASNMLYMAGKGTLEECWKMAEGAIEDKTALQTLANMFEGQGGNPEYIRNPELFPKASCSYEVKAPKAGYIQEIDAESCGLASVILGAGRTKKEDTIDMSAGIYLHKKYGDKVEAGETLAVLYGADNTVFGEAERKLIESYRISPETPPAKKLVYARVAEDGTEWY